MAFKFHLLLLMTILGITAHAQTDLPSCDYPHGVCVFHKDNCPPDIPYECASEYDCTQSTNKCCCRKPTPTTKPTKPTTNICDLPNEVGLCKGYFPRYYFDKEAGECKIFIYGGCGGNANNFETLVACQTTCPENCQVPKVTGPCKARILRYYFDKLAGKCKKFIYGGCRGNANNFKTLAACQKTCQDPQTCLLQKESGPCKAYISSYYFDKSTGECKEFIYGGCRGNANRFKTLAACQKTCQDPQTCLLPEEPGLCKARIPRYYFDKVAGKCKKFIYGGCGGNANNFATKGACNKKCLN